MKADEHFIEKGHKFNWPIKKVLGSLIIVIIVFAAGVQVGHGHPWFSRTSASATKSNGQLNYSSVDSVYGILKQNFDGNLDNQKLLDGLKSGLVGAAGDPYTMYFSAAAAKDFNNELQGTIVGIGAELGTDSDNNIVIVSPLSGYPAEKAGLKPKDIVAGVDGKTTQGMSVDTVVQKIRGNEGTNVTLTIVRSGGKPFDVTITRQKITVPSVKYEEDGDIGYMKISQFTNDTQSLAQKGAQEFKSKNVKAVILDLRGNPGGYLDAAVGVSSLWLDQGKTVVQERRGATVISTEQSRGGNILKGLPTIVLIDGGSASASEITAGALRDNDAAQLVGVKSFGKGSVQQVICLGDSDLSNTCKSSELKVTVARWYTPDGKNIDKQGISPDIQVTISDQDIAAGKDPQKDKATQILQSKIQ